MFIFISLIATVNTLMVEGILGLKKRFGEPLQIKPSTPMFLGNRNFLLPKLEMKINPSKLFLFSKTSWRRCEEVFGRRLANTSWNRLGRWKSVTLKASSRRPLDVFKLFLRHLQDMLERHLQQDVFKKTYFKYDLEVKKCFLEDAFKTLILSLSRKIFAEGKLDLWSLPRSSANTIMRIFNSRLLTTPRTRINVEIWFPIFLQKFLAASV